MKTEQVDCGVWNHVLPLHKSDLSLCVCSQMLKLDHASAENNRQLYIPCPTVTWHLSKSSLADARHTDQQMQHAKATGAGGTRHRRGITPEATYWTFLSHTHHHLSPGCPIGGGKGPRQRKREEGQPQREFLVGHERELRALRSVSSQAESSQQGEINTTGRPGGWRELRRHDLWWQNWVVHYDHMGTCHMKEREKKKVHLASLPLTDQHPRQNTLDGDAVERETIIKKKDDGDHGRKLEEPPLKPAMHTCERRPPSPNTWPYAHPRHGSARECLGAYLRSESLPSCSPSLFL